MYSRNAGSELPFGVQSTCDKAFLRLTCGDAFPLAAADAPDELIPYHRVCADLQEQVLSLQLPLCYSQARLALTLRHRIASHIEACENEQRGLSTGLG